MASKPPAVTKPAKKPPGKAPAPPPPAPAPPVAQAKKSPRATIPEAVALAPTSGVASVAERVVIFGTGGIGKTTLAAYLPAPYFLDAEEGTAHLNVTRDSVQSWMELRGKLAALEAFLPEGVRSVVIDTVTKVEELAAEHVIESRKTEKGLHVDSIEGFGWGKGWKFVHEEFIALLADLDRLVSKGVHVCLIAHDVSTLVPNPAGEDFLRWEPSLHSGDKRGRADIRSLLKNWADHVLFVGYDVHVADGKGVGSGSRQIYTQETPTHIAKSRSRAIQIPFDLNDPGAAWRELGIAT